MYLTTLLIIAAVLIVAFIIVAATRPADFRVSRSIDIHASTAALFASVNDLRQHECWSPFIQLDPAMKRDYTGPATGIGSSLHWDSKSRAGEGRMTLTESRPDERLGFRLDFLRPFKATNQAEFTFQPQGDATRVTWSMTGHNNFFFKAMSVFMDCEKMCGPEFEKGLAQLKTLTETPASSLVTQNHG